jgi:hypothetical protein
LVIVAKYLKLETMNDFIFFIQLVNWTLFHAVKKRLYDYANSWTHK